MRAMQSPRFQGDSTWSVIVKAGSEAWVCQTRVKENENSQDAPVTCSLSMYLPLGTRCTVPEDAAQA